MHAYALRGGEVNEFEAVVLPGFREFEVAEQYYLKAIEYFQQRDPQHGWYLKTIMNNLADLYIHLGRDAEASEWLARSAKLDNRRDDRGQ